MRLKQFMFALTAMLLSFASPSFAADNNVAKVGNTEYATIDEAVAAWTNNTTLTLLADVTLSGVVTLKSTEHHILNLGTYTMTAASGKNAFVIQACGTGSAERSAITINADATNPGGINAGSKCVVYYKYADGGISTNDRPIITINGGVFTGSTSSWGTAGIYTIGKEARKCATLKITGGTFNCSINGSGKSKLLVSGGVFNYSVGSQGDKTCYRLISGGTFKTFGFMTADNNNTKFWIGTSMANSNVGVYVDDNGYLVVGGDVVKEPGNFEASSANYGGWSSYLEYSSAKDNGLYYTSVEKALANNNKTSGSVTVYVDKLDMTGISYKGTIVVPAESNLTITNAPSTLVVKDENGNKLTPNANGTYSTVAPTAKIGDVEYATLAEAVAAAQAGDEIVVIADIADVTVDVTKNLTISGAATLNNVGINANGADALTVKGLTFTGNSWINSGTAEALTVSGVTATVAPSNTSYTNSRSAFISLGRSEGQELALTLKNNNITVTSSGPDAVLGWAKITAATITDNVIKGSNDGYFTNADAIKFMSIANGAEFEIKNNEIYSNYNGIVFAQNTTRDNAYSVSADANKFYGGADHIWIEISGGNTVHATFNATSANTVNGNAFTVDDIKYHNGVIKNWSSYAGVDVVTDANGKVIGGTLASFSNAESVAEGYEIGEGGAVAKASVAEVNGTKYTSLADALAAANAGDEIKLLANIKGDITVPAKVTLNGNGKQINGNLVAGGDLTFVGHTKVTSFNAGYNKPVITIGEGACLEMNGTGRMVIGHGATFNITGTITDAKTADKATLVPSLKIAAGASITGNGVTFNVNNAYIVANANTTSKNSNANGILDFNIENSIWEQTGVLAFYVPTSGMDPVVNFELKNSVLTTTSHLVFSVTKGEIVFDNSLVNQGTSRQLENRSTMTIKNGSVVNGAVATSQNAINPGKVIVEDATYAVTGEFSGAAEGTGTLIIKKGATVSAGSITKANITIDAAGMEAGELDGFTANLSKFTGTLSLINNDKLEAKIVDGKVVLNSIVAKIGDAKFASLQAAFDAVKAGETITVFEGTYAMPSMKAGITIVGEGDVVFEGTLTGTLENLTMKNIHIKGDNAQRWAYAKGNLVFENVTFEAKSVYALHFDGITEGTNLTYKNCTIIGWAAMGGSPASCVFEGCTIKGNGTYGLIRTYFDTTIKDCTFDVANVNTTDAYEDGIHAVDGAKVVVTNCTNKNVNGTMKDLVNVSDASVVTVDGVEFKNVANIGETYYETLDAAFAAAQDNDEVKIFAAGTYALTTSGKNITITGAVEGVVFDNIGAKNMGSANVTFNNVTFDYYPNVNYTGLQHSGNLTYNDCIINGQVFLYGTSETFNKCTFNQNSADAYNVWTYGAKDVDFNECTFNSVGKSVLVYNESTTATNDVAFTNCVLKASAAVEGKAAIEIDTSLSAGATITVDGATTATGFGSGNVSGNSLWNNKKGSNTDANNDITVVVNNETVLAPVTFVAKIGETGYKTLAEAISAAQTGETITLIADVELTETLNIPAGKTIALDLNGKTISQTKEQTAGYQMILNDGNLTIDDSSEAKTGKISYTDSGNGGEYISDVIYNRSVLVINGGTIENLSSATVASNGYPHAVDTYSGIRDTYVEINGGTIYCAEYSAIRMFCVSATNKADLVINGGTIKGAIDMQNGTKNLALGTLTINDGTFKTTKNANNIRFANWNGGATEYGISAEIKGGSFNGGITTAYVPAAANWDKGVITGGTFANDMTEYCAEGFVCEANGDGTYGIVADPNYIAEFTIDDAARVDYVNDTDKTVGTLTYKRTLAEGVWNPLYLPFQVDVAQLADNYDIAYYNQMLSSDSNNDGAFDSYIMEVAYITSGTLRANYPYFIRPKTSDDCYLEYVANDVTLCAAKETVIVTSSVANTFKLHGTHKTVSAADLAGCYTIKASGWVQTTIDLRPHRLYLEILENDNSPFVAAAAKSIRIVVRGEDGTTGVEEITGENGEDMIFDLQGRSVLEPEKGGLYIINGKKVIY